MYFCAMIALNVLELLKTLPTYKCVDAQGEDFTRYFDRQQGLLVAQEVIKKFEQGFEAVALSFEGVGKVSAPFLEGVVGKVLSYLPTHAWHTFTLTAICEEWQAEVERVMRQARNNFLRKI
jgi:hypothetical protein